MMLRIFLWVISCALATVAMAAPAQTELRLPVPQSELDLTARDTKPRYEADRSARISIFASSWSPHDFTQPSLSQDAGAFSRTGAPQLGVSWMSAFPGFSQSTGLDAEISASFLSMRREGSSLSGKVDQTAVVLPLGVGARWYPATRLSGAHGFAPYVSAGLLPTLMLSSRSSIDRGGAGWGVPLQGGLGLDVASSWIGIKDSTLGFAWVGTLGRVAEGQFSGMGARLALGFGM